MFEHRSNVDCTGQAASHRQIEGRRPRGAQFAKRGTARLAARSAAIETVGRLAFAQSLLSRRTRSLFPITDARGACSALYPRGIITDARAALESGTRLGAIRVPATRLSVWTVRFQRANRDRAVRRNDATAAATGTAGSTHAGGGKLPRSAPAATSSSCSLLISWGTLIASRARSRPTRQNIRSRRRLVETPCNVSIACKTNTVPDPLSRKRYTWFDPPCIGRPSGRRGAGADAECVAPRSGSVDGF